MGSVVRAYLKDTLGIDAPTSLWAGPGNLPYFLVDAFDLRALAILGRPVLLAIDKRTARPSLANIRTQIEKIRELTGLPVLRIPGDVEWVRELFGVITDPNPSGPIEISPDA